MNNPAVKLRSIKLIIILLFVFLALSLFNLQIIKGEDYSQIAENNFVRLKSIPPIRGEIYDQKYRPIAINKPSFNLYITLSSIRDKEELVTFLYETFSFDIEEIKDILHKHRYYLYQEILLLQNIEYETVIEVSEQLNRFPSLQFKAESTREYLYKNHFTGYVGKISQQEHERLKEDGYSINSIIGKTGIEKYYENKLAGKSGYEVIQVDASGKNLGFFKHNVQKPPVHGYDLILTINNDLQNYLAEIFPNDINGSVVVMDVPTGGILAYVSNPEFDQNIFTGKISTELWNEINLDPRKPMLDRLIHSTYPPGSVYKPVMTGLGLEQEKITLSSKFSPCEGGTQIGDRFFKCWFEDGHGQVSLLDALKVSCDVYFYNLSLLFTLNEIKQYTEGCLLTQKTGIDLVGERKGFFPTREWYVENYGKYVGIIGPKVNISIGQGELLTSPLQICAYYNALGNNGTWVKPHLLHKEIRERESETYKSYFSELPISEENLSIIQTGLYKAVNERYGTGTSSSFKDIKVYGKTGSAENHMGKDTHAWFSGFAVWETPEISFTVFMENAGHGGSIAAPFAAKLISFYDKIRSENYDN
ncbi:penicillin-binding protein 2 [Candidatus Cloacimonadota bacterium]